LKQKSQITQKQHGGRSFFTGVRGNIFKSTKNNSFAEEDKALPPQPTNRIIESPVGEVRESNLYSPLLDKKGNQRKKKNKAELWGLYNFLQDAIFWKKLVG